MAEFALNKKTKQSDPHGTTDPIHTSCGESLQKLPSGRWTCSKCMMTGHLEKMPDTADTVAEPN